jgi:hypothetical protein
MIFDDSNANSSLFDVDPDVKKTFGNRKNWRRFCAIARAMQAELALRRWV